MASFILLLLFVFPPFSNAQGRYNLPNPSGVYFQLKRDQFNLQYMIKFNQGTPLAEVQLVVDLGGKLPWFGCRKGYKSSSYRPFKQTSTRCSQADKPVNTCVSCNGTAKPHNNACRIYIRNPVTRNVGEGDLISEHTFVWYNYNPNATDDGIAYRRFAFGCAATGNLFNGLSKDSKGVAGLGRSSALSLVPQIASAFRLSRIFALQLYDKSGNSGNYETFDGKIYFGGGPYVTFGIDGDPTNNVLKLVQKQNIVLAYTPLLINPTSTEEYFIDVKSIKVHGETIPINKKLLSINKITGIGGTKIDIQIPYTTLETSIYKALIKVHAEWAERLNNDNLNVTTVAPVAPFTTCYNSSTMPPRGLSWKDDMPPGVAFIFPKSVLNISFIDVVRVKDGVDCVGFIDGGSKPVTSIVIGAHQAGFLEFDISKSRLGFVAKS